jgi:hypothetical protein
VIAVLLVVPAWLTLAWALIALVERSTPPAPRIVGAYRDVAIDVPDPEPLPDWATVPGPAVWSAGQVRGTNRTPPAITFPDPPRPQFQRQPQSTLLASVAEAFDQWEAHQTRRLTLLPTVVTYHPGAPVLIEQAA